MKCPEQKNPQINTERLVVAGVEGEEMGNDNDYSWKQF
jgi:hypothetical protein